MPLRIRILAGLLDSTAGSHVYNRELGRRFADRGYDVSVVAFREYDGLPRQFYELVFMPSIPRWPGAWRLGHLTSYLQCSFALHTADIQPCDVVIGAEHLFLKAHVRRFPSTPLIYLPHALVVGAEIRSYQLDPLREFIGVRLYEYLQRWALNNAAATVRFTRHACDVLTNTYKKVPMSRFIVNPMGVDLPNITPARPLGHEVRLIWVGQLIARKRLDVALKALADLCHLPWTFDIVGAGSSHQSLDQQVRELGLQDRVRFHGFRSDVAQYFSTADLMLFPSWLENSPVAMLESMSFGVPCLAMRDDGVRYFNANSEILTSGVDGFLAESDEDFTRVLKQLLENPQKLREVGVAARNTIERRHRWDQHIAIYEELFRNLVPTGKMSNVRR